MKTIPLEKQEQIEEIAQSGRQALIFKHNTSCPISKRAKLNLDTKGEKIPDDIPIFILDLLCYREISDAIADMFNIKHESPQLLFIKNGECSFHQSLYDISAEDVAETICCN